MSEKTKHREDIRLKDSSESLIDWLTFDLNETPSLARKIKDFLKNISYKSYTEIDEIYDDWEDCVDSWCEERDLI